MKLQHYTVMVWILFGQAKGIPLAGTTSSTIENNNTATGTLVNTLFSLSQIFNQPPSSVDDLGTFPYDGALPPAETNTTAIDVPPPLFGIAINTRNLLAPKVELFHLIESFLQLNSDIFTRVLTVYNENYQFLHALTNIALGKLAKLTAFGAKTIGFARGIMEFLFNILTQFSITLPSITFGNYGANTFQPHVVYGPPASNPVAIPS